MRLIQSSVRPRSSVFARLREMSDLQCPMSEERVSTVKVHSGELWHAISEVQA